MNETGDATEIASIPESPKPAALSPQPPQSTEQDRTLEELLAQCSSDSGHAFAASINSSATREAGKTEEFRQEFKKRLFRAMIGTYVWSEARLAHETEMAERRLSADVQELLSTEREQDLLRARLTEFMAAVGRALQMF